MSRFKNLELGQNQAPAKTGVPVPSAALCLHAAERAFMQGDFEAALRSYGRALEFQPDDPAAWLGQVRMFIELDDLPQAKSLADTALQRFPDHPELLAARAVTLARERQTEAALAFSDAAIEAAPQAPYVWLSRGDILLASGGPQSEFCFRQAIQLHGGTWLGYWLSSRVHHFHRKFTLALNYAQQALALDAAQSAVWLQLGRCQEALGLDLPAQNSFAQAFQLNPASLAAQLAQAAPGAGGFTSRLVRLARRLFHR
jgi:tetratricopeptide (TPR) repeat protein